MQDSLRRLRELRALSQRLLELSGGGTADEDQARLAEVHDRIDLRIGEMVAAARALAESDAQGGDWAREFDARMEEIARELG